MEPDELERFEAMMLPHLDAAYTLARYLTGDALDAEDVVQDAALRALKYFSGFRGRDADDGRAWFLAIVRNTARTARQRRRADRADTVFDEDQHSDAIAEDNPALQLDRTEARARLRAAMEELPQDFREVIVLREIQGLSYQEISEVTDAPVGTVMSRLSRARRRLQQLLVRGAETGGRVR